MKNVLAKSLVLFSLCFASAIINSNAQTNLSRQSEIIDSLLVSNPDLALIESDNLYEQALIKHDTVFIVKSLRYKADAFQLISVFDSAEVFIDSALSFSASVRLCENALSLNIKAQIHRKKGEYQEALDILFPSLKIFSLCYKEKEILNSLYLIALCYDRLEMYSEAIATLKIMSSLSEALENNTYLFRSYNTAFMIFTKSGKRPEPLMQKLISTAQKANDPALELTAYNNLASYFTRNNDNESAEYCYLKAYELTQRENNLQNKAIISLNLCIFYNRIGNWHKAEPYFEESMALQEYFSEDNWIGLYFFFESIYYRNKSMLPEAQSSLEKSMAIMEAYNNYPLLLDIHLKSADFYEERGNYEKAFYHMSRYREIKAILDENEEDSEVNRLYYSVLLDLEKEKAKTILLRNENLEKQQKIYLLLIAIAIILIIVSALIYYFNSARFRARILRVERQHESVLAARLRLSKELSERNKEIAAVVLNQVMQNEQGKDVINRLRKVGEKCTKEVQKELFELAGILGSAQNKKIWSEFEKYFKQLNPDFFFHLTDRHKNLTSRDLRYCALISLQLSSKEMSLITGMTLQSIHVLRSRLRHKLGLEKDDDLAVYLSSFGSE